MQITLLCILLLLQSTSLHAASKSWWEAAARDSGHPTPVEYIQSLSVFQTSPALLDKAYFESLVVSADRGDTTAQYVIGIAYINGKGVSKNKAAGRRWLNRASDSGHARAKLLLESGIPDYYNLAITAAPAAGRTATPGAAKATPSPQPGSRKPVTDAVPSTTGQPQAVQPGKQGLVDKATATITGTYDGKYWSWWMGALGLTFLALGFWVATGNTLGVSSSWDRLVSFRESHELEKANAALASASQDDIERAMMEATLEQFGDDIPDEMREQLAQMEVTKNPVDSNVSREQRAPYGAHVMFLLFMTLGGTLAAFTNSDLVMRMNMGSEFVKFFGEGPGSWIILLIGGIFIGFGTRMGGGCTSGHALSGCSRLQVGSLVGTAAFFGTGIVVSMLLARILG